MSEERQSSEWTTEELGNIYFKMFKEVRERPKTRGERDCEPKWDGDLYFDKDDKRFYTWSRADNQWVDLGIDWP